ncbi:hypothetical protein PI124_g15213 [Phytophthora idaei]|nr:hypothetical protein PI124_g15213 [Phytophthora idaei]
MQLINLSTLTSPAEQKEHPVLGRDQKFQVLLLTNTLSFADAAINLVEYVADVMTPTPIIPFPDMLLL